MENNNEVQAIKDLLLVDREEKVKGIKLHIIKQLKGKKIGYGTAEKMFEDFFEEHLLDYELEDTNFWGCLKAKTIPSLEIQPVTLPKTSVEEEVKAKKVKAKKQKNEPSELKKDSTKTSTSLCKAVACVETGEKFSSITEAASKMGLHYQAIGKVINGKIKSTGGYTFIRV